MHVLFFHVCFLMLRFYGDFLKWELITTERAKKINLASDQALLQHPCVASCQPPELTVPLTGRLIRQTEATSHAFLHSLIHLFSHSLIHCAIPFVHQIQSKRSPCSQDVVTAFSQSPQGNIICKLGEKAQCLPEKTNLISNNLPNIVKILTWQSLVRRETYRFTREEMHWFLSIGIQISTVGQGFKKVTTNFYLLTALRFPKEMYNTTKWWHYGQRTINCSFWRDRLSGPRCKVR